MADTTPTQGSTSKTTTTLPHSTQPTAPIHFGNFAGGGGHSFSHPILDPTSPYYLSPADSPATAPTAYAAKETIPYGRRRDNNSNRTANTLLCEHCKNPNHTKDRCFKLIGYPPGWEQRGNNRGKGKANSIDNNVMPKNLNESTDQPPKSLTPEQLDQFLSLIEAHKTATPAQANFVGKVSLDHKNNMQWILDSGASHHFSSDNNLQNPYNVIPGFPVTLPNGSTVTLNKAGSVQISPNFTLKNVYYAPDFNCNLLSISKLTRDFNCAVIFTSNSCYVQDLDSKTVIGRGSRRDGIYFFDPGSGKASATRLSQSDPKLWHQHLDQRLYTSREVVFYESIFPFQLKSHIPHELQVSQSQSDIRHTSEPFSNDDTNLIVEYGEPNVISKIEPNQNQDSHKESSQDKSYSDVNTNSPISPVVESISLLSLPIESPQRPQRHHRPPQYLNDYLCNMINGSSPSQAPSPSLSLGLKKASFADCAKHDADVSEDTQKNFAELLSDELKLRAAEALENQQHADKSLLEAKKMTSQYQKEADK
ncbi:hypothetical protein BUALT_Bualt18G0012700 [Buddleja alternifolia]|uniref:Retrovirus-related Pol polyprotein from transposon TNT 1-94-like beta-barrel domain-containing protein n=1 Tax=Buddleja alternifolia TaxID=168488 RepID=A0AAV6W1I6_9LAMI|nr:hypothetical protein BUALT_Bualt18G0012700 [Buddleja alternifolia]